MGLQYEKERGSSFDDADWAWSKGAPANIVLNRICLGFNDHFMLGLLAMHAMFTKCPVR